jgi:cytochrome c oxidase cbb3-type subunit III
MNRITLTLLISLYFSVLAWSQVDAGKKIFEDNCTSCHSIGGGKIVGPDLQGVTERRKEDWIKKFVVNSQALIAAGDAEAKAVFDENGQIPMPEHGHLKEADLNALVDYFKSTSAAPAPAPEAAPAADTKKKDAIEVEEQSSLPGYMYVFFILAGIILVCLLVILYQLIGLFKKFK